MALIMILASVPVMAANLPNAFWKLNDNYTAALEAKDYPAIARYAAETIDMVSALPEDEQVIEIVGSRAYEAGFAYYYMGDYENSVKYFNIYLISF